ncbi:MAG: hypothetical protein JO202_01710 [Ktedonobacteraceae bacterium]|nr:hypothetical protein [Ktedonobacteraceae bacterium]
MKYIERVLLVVLRVIGIVEQIPYDISYYVWLLSHHTVGRLMLLVTLSRLRLRQKQARKSTPYWRNTR